MNTKIKKVSNLSPDDFEEYPIWGWYENIEDESLVTPVEEEYLLTSDYYDEYDSLFILSALKLQDSTELQGEIALRLDTRQVYMVGFFKDNEIFTFSLHPSLQRFNPLYKLSNWLQRPVEKIFPIKYKTLYFFNDGLMIRGEINLPGE